MGVKTLVGVFRSSGLSTLFRVNQEKTKVRLAYMEFVEPTLLDVARECVGQQTLHLRILPLFLSIGVHLASDVPEQVNQAKAHFPHLEVELLAPVGDDPRLARLIQQIVIETLNH